MFTAIEVCKCSFNSLPSPIRSLNFISGSSVENVDVHRVSVSLTTGKERGAEIFEIKQL